MKKNSCTPINPKKYSCYGLKKNSYKEFDNEKKFLRLENSPLPPHNFSNGPSLSNDVFERRMLTGSEPNSLFNMPWRFQICFSYGDDLPKNLFKTIVQECKKSPSGWRACLKMVAAFNSSHLSTTLVPKSGKYCTTHHPRRTLGSCSSPLIPWSWYIQWSKLLEL